jgi:23S rRNA (pseudouridine1915-N3)-methyltransferase
MQWRLFAIGKPKLGFAREGVVEYAKRLRPLAGVTIEYLSEGMHRVVLDESGEQCTSLELAGRIGQWEQERFKTIALLIGGADGHAAELRARADWVWSLSRLTLQHELALVVVLEQLYRAYAITGGLPYHRGAEN